MYILSLILINTTDDLMDGLNFKNNMGISLLSLTVINILKRMH